MEYFRWVAPFCGCDIGLTVYSRSTCIVNEFMLIIGIIQYVATIGTIND